MTVDHRNHLHKEFRDFSLGYAGAGATSQSKVQFGEFVYLLYTVVYATELFGPVSPLRSIHCAASPH